MTNSEQENSAKTSFETPAAKFNPIWALIGMGVIFVGMIVFEIFFKAKH